MSPRIPAGIVTATALAALLAGALPVQGQQTGLLLEDYYRIIRPTGVAVSPAGSRVAYTRSQVLEDENRTHSEIWLASLADSTAPFRLTSPVTDASDPRWTPDGRLLAFSSSRGGSDGTWFLRLDRPSGEAFQIDGLRGRPLFDPTGRRFAFLEDVAPDGDPEGAGAGTPAAASPLTPGEERILARFDGRAYDWMNYRFDRQGYLPDPRDPAATPPAQLFIMPATGGEPRQLTDLPVDVMSPVWRPDGEALAFVADAHARDEHSYEQADLWTVSMGGQVTRLTDDEYNYGAPDWAPGGTRLVVRGNVGLDVVIRERWDNGAPIDLFVFHADGSERLNLTEAWDFIPGPPRWSADGRWVYFTGGIGGNTHLFRVASQGGEIEQLTHGDGRVADVSFSRDFRTVAYAFQSPTDPGNVYVGTQGRGARRLTDLNGDWLAERALSSPDRLSFASGDGTPIEGWMLPPAGAPGGAGHPMVLTIHGGPHGAYGNEFAFDRHILSAKGYYVLYLNPRASTGYGEAFRWGTWGSWGDEDYQDVMAGVDHALANYPVDPRRLGVTGYSYGGYLTNWIITQTDRFSAAAAGASISNWVSDYGTADIPRTKESEFFGPPWEPEGRDNLIAASPIFHAGGVSTPTLFLHGESDHRVPIEEAEQMYVALRKQQVPAKFIRYPDSYHGGWTPWRYLHRVLSTVHWMDQWLGASPVS
ncbi:MAG: S9 family peptidase [Gemmatimonadota bacterium]|nr:S9 family peptidase [Gemmatimonadota bacterium]